MSEQLTQEKTGIKINEDRCSGCAICTYVCPFEAVKRNAETGKTTLDVTKCQVCGLCYSTCPAKAIDIEYYDVDALTEYLEQARQKNHSNELVVMCKGSAPDFSRIEELFGVKNFIPLSVPCIGRIPEEVFMQVLSKGMEKINILACDEDYCRFESGSAVAKRKVIALNILLEQLGYGKETIIFKQNSLKVKLDADLCIACGNCVYYCPYNAPKLDRGSVKIDLEECRGCGLCVAMCPSFALELDNWEGQRISGLVTRLAAEMTSPKILAFRCQWAAFPSLNGGAQNAYFIDLPCASRVDMQHILEAFQKGIDGVMVVACSEEDCKQEKASAKAQRSVARLTERLKQLGLQDRLYFCTVAPRYPERLEKEVAQFRQKIESTRAKESGI